MVIDQSDSSIFFYIIHVIKIVILSKNHSLRAKGIHVYMYTVYVVHFVA